jgi:hypothetical protein
VKIAMPACRRYVEVILERRQRDVRDRVVKHNHQLRGRDYEEGQAQAARWGWSFSRYHG